MNITASDMTAITSRIPRLFHLLAALGDALHEDVGVTNAMRGVMASLSAHGPRTVPDLARDRPVSRQYIQTLVDNLAARGLVASQPNPAHRRSPLIALTARGEAVFAMIRAKETTLLAKASPSLAPADMDGALRTLSALERSLSALLAEETARA